MAPMIFDGPPTSLELAHLFGSREEQRLHRYGPSEKRIEGYIGFTQEQLSSLEDIMAQSTILLVDCDRR